MEQCNGTLTWAPAKDKSSDISPGMKMKYTSGARENITYLDEGFIDLSTLKTVELGYVDMLTVPKQTLLAISNCYRSSSGNSYNAHVQLSLIFGSSLHQNKVDFNDYALYCNQFLSTFSHRNAFLHQQQWPLVTFILCLNHGSKIYWLSSCHEYDPY